MGLRGLLNPSFAERQKRHAKKLRKLRGTRIREESRAKLRTIEQSERARISKARSAGRPKSGSRGGSDILGKIDKASAWARKVEKRQKKFSGF